MRYRRKSLLPAESAWARVARRAYRPLVWLRSRPWYLRWRAPFLDNIQADDVFVSERGVAFGPDHMAQTNQVPGRDLLVMGCGSGREVTRWSRLHPASIVAIDIQAQANNWLEVAAACSGCRARFFQMDGVRLALRDRTFDLVVSDGFLEHVADVESCLAEMARVVRPGGMIYAAFGPLFHACGGGHSWAAGGYDHLLLSPEEFTRRLGRDDDEARVFWALGMFSRWRLDQYLTAFRHRFQVDYLALVLSKQGLAYRRRHPQEWKELTQRFPERDLLVKSVIARLRPLAT